MSLSLILLIVLILILVGALPTWGHSRNWGYGPSGGLGLVVVILIIGLMISRPILSSRLSAISSLRSYSQQRCSATCPP